MTIRSLRPFATPYAVEIGGTWLATSAQRSGINTEAKLLLLDYAFETWHVGRVDLKTDARNDRSRNAILRIGASFEGVLRHWQPSLVEGEEGTLRDSAMFSIVDSEWPSVRERLTSLLDHYARD
jgi:RimJ/RimL family protein N-acetyltransferase